jgi:AcrR family transcriptional regulator
MLMFRKSPSQTRSIQTVETIYEAAAQIVELEGVEKFNTNKLAERAGFSIGTVYQYFPNKKSLLTALANAGQSIIFKHLDNFVEDIENNPSVHLLYPPDVFRQYIQALVSISNSESVVTRVAFRLCWTFELTDVTIAVSKAITERLLSCLIKINHPQLARPSQIKVFLLVRSFVGITRHCILEKYPFWGSTELENELVTLVWGILRNSADVEEIRSKTTGDS